MTVYRTCRNCAINPYECDRRKALTAALKGLGVTSVKFACSERKPLFRIGQRVGVTWTVSGDYEDSYQETWPATVIKESGPRFLIHVDDVDSDEGTPASGFIKNESRLARPSTENLRALDEPDRTICQACGSDGSLCHNQFNEIYWPERCIRKDRP